MRGFSRTFIVILVGQFISIAGSTLTGVGMGFWIVEQTGTVTGYAINMLMFFLPGILLSPAAGIIVDRIDRRWAMIISDSGAALTTLVIFALLLSGRLEVWHVYGLVFLGQVFGTLQWPAYSAAVTQMVPKEKLGQAGGMTELARALPQLFAPALAGVLYVAGGLALIIAVDVITFLAAVLSLVLVRLPAAQTTAAGAAAQREPFFQQMTFGLRYIRRRASLMGLLLYYALFNVLFAMFETLILPLMLTYYAENTVGIAISVAGVGTLLGSVIMSVWGGPQRRVVGILGSGLLAFSMMALLGTTVQLGWVLGYAFFMLLALPILAGSSQALWQAKVEQDVQGRVFAVRQVAAQILLPAAYLSVGPLADGPLQRLISPGGALYGLLPVEQGASVAFVLFGVLGVIATLLAWAVPAVRRADFILPDAPDQTELAAAPSR